MGFIRELENVCRKKTTILPGFAKWLKLVISDSTKNYLIDKAWFAQFRLSSAQRVFINLTWVLRDIAKAQ